MSVRLVALLVAAIVIGLAISKVRAQDGHHGAGHAEAHDWYRDLKQPFTGYSCCNGDTVDADGQLKQLAPDGRSHICATKSGMIYCFLGGSPKS